MVTVRKYLFVLYTNYDLKDINYNLKGINYKL